MFEVPTIPEYRTRKKKLTKAEARAEARAIAKIIIQREMANGLLAEDSPEVVAAMEEILLKLSK